MDNVDFYLYDLQTKFNKINPKEYYLSYSGSKDSHFLLWFIKEYLHNRNIMICEVNICIEKGSGLKPILEARGTQYKSCFTEDGIFTPLYDMTDELLEAIYKKYNVEISSVNHCIEKGDGSLKEIPKIYIIKKITDHDGNDKTEGRYPLRIGRRFAFGLGEPSPNMLMAICYRPRQNDDYAGTLRTSVVQKVIHNEDKMIVTTKNSVYHFEEEK